MKPIITLVALLSATIFSAQANLLNTLSKHRAELAVEFLSKHHTIAVFNSCENGKKEYIRIESVTAKHTGNMHFYQVVVTGERQDGSRFEQAVDLTHVFVNINGQTCCVGKKLRFFCDPCITTFAWDSPFANYEHFEKRCLAQSSKG